MTGRDEQEQASQPRSKAQGQLQARMSRVETLVTALEACPDPAVRESARELIETLMEFHGSALSRMLELIAGETVATPIDRIARDPLAGSLLLMYGLHPADLETRIREALEEVRPALHAHRGDVELISVSDDGVHLRLVGTCHGCQSSSTTFRNLIENAISERAPEVQSIHVEGMVSS